ncbi:MAG: aminomethyltransferase beta-barrel domain-containing protein, partial [Candidatus Paceibacteria bacterium]
IENSDLRNHYNHYGRIELEGVNWIGEAPKEGKEYEAEIRYHGERHPVTVGGNTVTFETPVLAAAGQSLVLYDPKVGMCLGGGIIVGNADC